MRVIESLRALYPGKWSYDAETYRWNHESGWFVYAESMMAPRYDGDDDSFVTRYRRSDTLADITMEIQLNGVGVGRHA